MKIQIISGEKEQNIILPTRLLLNHFTAKIAEKKLALAVQKDGYSFHTEELSQDALPEIFRELNRMKRKYGQWELVEVISADGDCVRVVL